MDPKSAIERHKGTKQSKDDLSLDKVVVVVSRVGPISSTYVKSITYGCKDKFANIALTKEERKANGIAAWKRYYESPKGIAWWEAYNESLEVIAAARKRYYESPKGNAWYKAYRYRESPERVDAQKKCRITYAQKPIKYSNPTGSLCEGGCNFARINCQCGGKVTPKGKRIIPQCPKCKV